MTNTAIVSANLKQLSQQFDQTRNAPAAIRPAHLATAKQLAYLTSLIFEYGKEDYHIAKEVLGIDSTLMNLTRREAYELINLLNGREP